MLADSAQEFVLAPLGDIQYTGEADQIAEGLLQEHLAYCNSLGAYYVGTGDYIDFMSPSNRQRVKSAALYDNAEDVIDRAAINLVEDLYVRYLKKTQGRWLGLVSGHHYSQLSDGTTTDQALCEMLYAPYLGTCAQIEIDFGPSSRVCIWLHHGSGSGDVGAVLRRLKKISGSWDASIFLMGHQPKIEAARIPRLYQSGTDLHHHDIFLVATGGWARAYVPGRKRGGRPQGDYAEQGMMEPAAIGAPIIRIQPRWVEGRFNPRIRIEI
jgi:hypothetical protein